MRSLIKIIVGLLVLGAAGRFAIPPLLAYWRASHKTAFRQAEVTRGEIISAVNSTGTVQPVLTVQVGSFVSGPLQKVHVDFNAKVTKGQVLAEVDPMISKAQRAQAKANLTSAKANLMQTEAKLEQAKQDWERAKILRPANAIADSDYDLAKSTFEVAKANVAVSQAMIEQSTAALQLAEANLGYTTIRSPVDGVVIDRKVDTGQTVASQFQTPELFKVAPDIEKRIFIFASVDEADIGLIRDAKQRERSVAFTVDAYPNDIFYGKIYQVRLNPTTTQNVVTYPVVVECANPDLKLLPGMTASLSFEIEKHDNVLRVPNAAIRFFPKPAQVRPEDRHLLEGDDRPPTDDKDRRAVDAPRSVMERAEAVRNRNRRHVWIVEDDLLKAVEIVTGLNDSKYSEVVSGSLTEGQSVVTGVEQRKP